jgi:hypothetical protein
MIKQVCAGALLSATALVALSSQAATVVVDAYANSSSGGVAVDAISLTAGQAFSISSSLDDLWSAGALPRYSDANGLTGERYATAADDSGQPVGTHIGTDFGTWTQNGHTAAFGSLVGEIGGQYITLGANYSGVAPTSGTLHLYYWDSNYGDNSGQITFNVSAVPEPGMFVMLLAGLLVLAPVKRRMEAFKRD